jgi:hypothetical protein
MFWFRTNKTSCFTSIAIAKMSLCGLPTTLRPTLLIKCLASRTHEAIVSYSQIAFKLLFRKLSCATIRKFAEVAQISLLALCRTQILMRWLAPLTQQQRSAGRMFAPLA